MIKSKPKNHIKEGFTWILLNPMVYPLNVHSLRTHSWDMEKIFPSALSFRETEIL